MANNLKCADCCYFWQEGNENHPYCHWESRCPDDKAPCEYDDDDYVEEPDYPDDEDCTLMMCDAHGVCAGSDCPKFNECTRKDDAEHDWR